MSKHSIFTVSLEKFLSGDAEDMDTLDIDRIFSKSIGRVVRELLQEDAECLIPEDFAVETTSIFDRRVSFIDVPAGLIACDDNGTIIGGYLSCDLALADEWQGKGIGKEIVLEYFLRNEELPTWNLDTPAYSPAGLAAHRSAWSFSRENPEITCKKLESVDLHSKKQKARKLLRP